MTTSTNLYSILSRLSKAGAEPLADDDSSTLNSGAFAEKIVQLAHQHGIEADRSAVAAQLDTLQVLNELVKIETTLVGVFKGAEDNATKARRIQTLASSHGMTADLGALEELLRIPEYAETAELDDAELADVAGGGNFFSSLVGVLQYLGDSCMRFGQLSNQRDRRQI